MTDVRIRRHSQQASVAVGTSAEASTTMSAASFAGAAVLVSGVTASATLTVYGSHDGTKFAPVHDSTGAAVTLVVAADGGALACPDAVHGLRFVRLVSDSDIGTSASVVVTLRS